MQGIGLLLLRPFGGSPGGLGKGERAGRHGVGTVDDFADQSAHAIAHFTQRLGNALQFILTGQLDRHRQITGGQLPGAARQHIDGRGKAGIGQIEAGTGEQHATGDQQQGQPEVALRFGQFITEGGDQKLLAEPGNFLDLGQRLADRAVDFSRRIDRAAQRQAVSQGTGQGKLFANRRQSGIQVGQRGTFGAERCPEFSHLPCQPAQRMRSHGDRGGEFRAQSIRHHALTGRNAGQHLQPGQ